MEVAVIQQIGAYAGLLAVIGLVLLALLYFSQARDVKRLREWAGRAPDRAAQGSHPPKPFSEEEAEVYKPRRASLRMPRISAPAASSRYLAVGLVVLAVAGVAVAVGVTVLGGGGEGQSKRAKKKDGSASKPALNPSRITVSVLNGTATPGLASAVGKDLEDGGFKVGTVTNASGSDFAETVVLYKPGFRREADFVAKKVKAKSVRKMDSANEGLVGSSKVAVVAGQDKASSTAAGTTQPQASPPPTAQPQTAQPAAPGAVQ